MFTILKIPLLITTVALVATFFFGGLAAVFTIAVLGILEISLSFDNAVVNAKILGRMNEKWQKIFLTVGILIAVFGMRLIFPLLIVALASSLNPIQAVQLALQQPNEYAHYLHQTHPSIAAFGGVFLGMLFLDWLFEDREIQWLGSLERAFTKIGKLENMSVVIMATALIIVANLIDHGQQVLFAGLFGLVTYLAVNALDSLLENSKNIAAAGIGAFLYLELIDASFSFDGVIGAFAITSNIIYIAIGLGIGAMYIRGLTVYLVRKNTLQEYVYLEHGAHWAIGALAVILLLTIKYDVPELVSGLIGVAFIATSFIHSYKLLP